MTLCASSYKHHAHVKQTYFVMQLARGVSLIEMLLVIAVLAVISLGAVQFIQLDVENKKAETLSHELQNLVVATRDYYFHEREWPTAVTDLNKISSDIASNTTSNPFGSPYTLNITDPVTISTEVPSSRVGQWLVARLPFSYLDGNTLHIGVTKPTTVTWFEGGDTPAKLMKVEQHENITVSSLRAAKSTQENDIYLYDVPGTLTDDDCEPGFRAGWAVGLKEFGYGAPGSGTPRTSHLSHFSLCGKKIQNRPSSKYEELCYAWKPKDEAGNENAIAVNLMGFLNGDWLLWSADRGEPWFSIVVFHYCRPEA